MELTAFLNQTALYEAPLLDEHGVAITNEWDVPQFHAPIEIAVRHTKKRSLYIQATRVTAQFDDVYLTEHPVAYAGRIDGEDINAVTELVDFDGTVIGYKAYPSTPAGFSSD